ncbi:MAG: hypothetical protein LBV78_12595 [Kitasatospora sp.]|nr:hypothetical protein [Kitasatospora sp.]
MSLLILALAELLLLSWLLLRHLVRRQGGRRRAWRGLARQVRLTRRAFSDPVREFLGFHAAVRQLTRLLGAEGTAALARHALDGADTAVHLTTAQAFGFAVTVRPATRRDDGRVAVRLAGRGVPRPAKPWGTDDDPSCWHTTAVDAEQLAQAGQDGAAMEPAPRLLVPLGLSDDGIVFLDLLSGPRILSTRGDRRATRDFVQAVAAGLDLPGEAADVRVTHGVHPRFDGPELDTLLDSLTGRTSDPARPVVVVCASPDDAQSARLSDLARAEVLCAVVVGPVSAHRWEIQVDSRGRTETPGLGIETNAAPLGPAAARTARRRARRDRHTPVAVRPAGPPPPAGPQPRRPESLPGASGTRASRPPAPLRKAPEAAARTAVRAGAPSRGTAPAGRLARPDTPAAAPVPAPEPPASAVRELFAEPEITGVSAAGRPDTEALGNSRDTTGQTHRAERRNEP